MGNKIRKLGDITQDLEVLLLEMVDHELQWGEIKALVDRWLEIHAPGAQEQYDDGTVPINFYGHESALRGLIGRTRKAASKRKRS